MEGAKGADLERGDAVSAVVDGAGGAGKMEDVVDVAYIEGLANILLDKFEARFAAQVGQIRAAAGE